MLKTLLKSGGLDLTDVKLINVRYGLTQALLSHKIDAFTGGMRNFEAIKIALVGETVRLFYPEDYGMPHYDELILVINKNKINDPRFKKFVQAMGKGVDYLRKHPKSSWQIFAKNHPELNNPLNEKVWFKTIPYFALHPERVNLVQYEHYARYLKLNEIYKNDIDLSKYLITSQGGS